MSSKPPEAVTKESVSIRCEEASQQRSNQRHLRFSASSAFPRPWRTEACRPWRTEACRPWRTEAHRPRRTEAYRLSQYDILTRNVLAGCKPIRLRMSPVKVVTPSAFAKPCRPSFHTTKSVEPGRYSQRNT